MRAETSAMKKQRHDPLHKQLARDYAVDPEKTNQRSKYRARRERREAKEGDVRFFILFIPIHTMLKLTEYSITACREKEQE
jgi:hypothetical protein